MAQQNRQYQADDDLLMEFVLAPDDPTGKKILRTPMRVNVEDLARPGGVTIMTTDEHGSRRQATMVVDEDDVPNNNNNNNNNNNDSNDGTDSDADYYRSQRPATASGRQQQHRAEVVAMDSQSKFNPIDAKAMEQMQRESQLDAQQGRRPNTVGRPAPRASQFVDGEWAHGTFVASIAGRPADLDDDDERNNQLSASSVVGAGGILVDDGRQPNIRCCAAVNKRSFGPPPLRRFAYTGYTNAVWGGDGARRLLITGGLSKVSVEHEVYEYSLCGQRWRRLECLAEAHTPQGLPIAPLARHSHSASIILESGQGGDGFMVIFGGVGLGGRVVPADALETRQSRQNFEELFGTDPETFARNLRAQEPALQICSVVDLIAGEVDARRAPPHHHTPSVSAASYSRDHTPAQKEYDGYHEPPSRQATYNAGTVMSVGAATSPTSQVGVLDEVYELNLRTRLWRKIPVAGCAPPHLCEHTSVAFGSRIIVYGGTTMEMLPAGGAYLHFLEARRNSNRGAGGARGRTYEWSMRALEPAPAGRSRHTAVASSPDTMTVFGGIGAEGTVLGDLWMLHEVNSSEPYWTKIQLSASGGGSETNAVDRKQAKNVASAHQQGEAGNEAADTEHKREEDERLQHLFGRSGHSACMSYGHRLLIVGGQSERGVVSSILEIQLGRAIVDGAAEAVCRQVKVGGDALPRYCFGCSISAGDGVSAVVFGGQKTWKEDLKKLQMLKNPTPQEIARLRKKAKEQESLTNGVFVFTYPELTGRERKKYEHKLLIEAKKAAGEIDSDDSDADSDKFVYEDEDNKQDEVPESFLKFVARSHKGFTFMWEKVKEQQQNLDNEAKIFASTKIHIPKEKAEALLDLLHEASGFLCEQRPEERIPGTVSDRDDRSKALDQTQIGVQQALQVSRLKKGRDGKQQLHYIAIEQHLAECHKGLAKLKHLQKNWNAPPHMKEWFDDHEHFLASATEKLSAVSDFIRAVKKSVVADTLKRINEANERSKMSAEETRNDIKRQEEEMMSKTAMEHVKEERKQKSRSGSAVNKKNRGASWGKPPPLPRPPRATSPKDEKKQEKKRQQQQQRQQQQKKRSPLPEYGDQIPELEIVVIENDRNVHARLVRVCRHEVGVLKAKIAALNDTCRANGNYDKVFASLAQIETHISQIEGDLPAAAAAPAKKSAPQQRHELGNQHVGAREVDESQKLKTLPILQHSKSLVDCGKDLKKFAHDANRPDLVDDVKKLEGIKESADNLDKVSRSFRQYWHLTFLSRGYERGGKEAAAQAKIPSRPSSSSRPSSRGPPRCASISTASTPAFSSGAAVRGGSNQHVATNSSSGGSSRTNRPPLAASTAATTLPTTTTPTNPAIASQHRPVQIQPLPPGGAGSSRVAQQQSVREVNTYGSVQWNQQRKKHQGQQQQQPQQQEAANPGAWAVLQAQQPPQQQQINHQSSTATVFQSTQASIAVPSSSQVDWLRGNASNGNNVQIGGNPVPLLHQQENQQPQLPLNQQQQQSVAVPTSNVAVGATIASASSTATAPTKPKPKTASDSRPTSSSTSTRQDPLFKGTRNLTPGERKILEARSRKN